MPEKSSTQLERIADVEDNVPDVQTEAQTQRIAAKSETFEGPKKKSNHQISRSKHLVHTALGTAGGFFIA